MPSCTGAVLQPRVAPGRPHRGDWPHGGDWKPHRGDRVQRDAQGQQRCCPRLGQEASGFVPRGTAAPKASRSRVMAPPGMWLRMPRSEPGLGTPGNGSVNTEGSSRSSARPSCGQRQPGRCGEVCPAAGNPAGPSHGQGAQHPGCAPHGGRVLCPGPHPAPHTALG